MKTVVHRAESRGRANHGWLDSHHTFSFANYHNPDRMNFGVLRVLNDDVVAPGMGFGTHHHDNMEIISIPLEGNLRHQDNMGNTTVIKQGDVQVMSAGTGIYHSEFNASNERPVKFLQIWVFPNQRDVMPRYDQITLDAGVAKNQLHQILSPTPKDDGVWIHQNAWFYLGFLDQGVIIDYRRKDPENGIYIFIIRGGASVENQSLLERDGLGIWEANQISIKADTDTKILLMEVPMGLE